MKSFMIGGEVIDDSATRFAYEDVTPMQVRNFLAKLEDGEEATFDITSPGGSCTGGIAIANMIREASRNGHKCTAHVLGLAASIASVIACACDEIVIDESAFMMVHNPWTVAQGDAETLRKSADDLDKFKAAIMSFYRGKFAKTDDEITALMDAETWFTGAECETFGFKATVLKSNAPLKAAACAREIPNFAHAPKCLNEILRKGAPVAGESATAAAESATAAAESATAAAEGATAAAEGTTAAAESATAAAESATAAAEGATGSAESATAAGESATPTAESATCTKAEADKRVQGMQAAMQKQINDFKDQLKDAHEKLQAANAVRIQLEGDLMEANKKAENVEKELSDVKGTLAETQKALDDASSACDQVRAELATREKALATLNARVNASPRDELPTMADGLARCKTLQERVDFLKAGKYTTQK